MSHPYIFMMFKYVEWATIFIFLRSSVPARAQLNIIDLSPRSINGHQNSEDGSPCGVTLSLPTMRSTITT